jgi:hypothetical protein
VIRINPFDYFNNLGKKSELIESHSEIMAELDKLGEVNGLIENFERNSFFHCGFFTEKAKNKHLASKIKELNLELREKDLINERLQSFGNNLGLVRTCLHIKDEFLLNKIKHGFFVNDFSSIPAITKELNEFKDKINDLEQNYKAMINEEHSSIDFKANHQHLLEEHLKNLHNTHKKQKMIFQSMGLMFTKHFKSILKGKNLKTK